MASARRTVYVVTTFLAAALVVAACGTRELDGAQFGSDPPPAGACATPNAGCPCERWNEEVECGQVKQRSGDFVACAMGTRMCVGGTWGACVSTHITTKTIASGHVATQAISQGPCPASGPLSNPCDPYCHQIIDTGTIAIPGVPPGGSCAYYEPADANASYLAINGAWQAIRNGSAAAAGACSTGTSDARGHDSFCSGGTGCVYYTAGQKNRLAAARTGISPSTRRASARRRR